MVPTKIAIGPYKTLKFEEKANLPSIQTLHPSFPLLLTIAYVLLNPMLNIQWKYNSIVNFVKKINTQRKHDFVVVFVETHNIIVFSLHFFGLKKYNGNTISLCILAKSTTKFCFRCVLFFCFYDFLLIINIS